MMRFSWVAKKRFIVGAMAAALVSFALWFISPWVFFAFNATKSIDGNVFLIVRGGEINKGDLVAFQPPTNRFYGDLWFVKYAKGVEGDEVSYRNGVLYINESPSGPVWEHAKDGSELHPGPSGLIPEGYVFAWTPHPRSFDSRYSDIGWVSHEKVIGRAYRIF